MKLYKVAYKPVTAPTLPLRQAPLNKYHLKNAPMALMIPRLSDGLTFCVLHQPGGIAVELVKHFMQ